MNDFDTKIENFFQSFVSGFYQSLFNCSGFVESIYPTPFLIYKKIFLQGTINYLALRSALDVCLIRHMKDSLAEATRKSDCPIRV